MIPEFLYGEFITPFELTDGQHVDLAIYTHCLEYYEDDGSRVMRDYKKDIQKNLLNSVNNN